MCNLPVVLMAPVIIPAEQRMTYNKFFEQLARSVVELDPHLPTYACILDEDTIRKLVMLVRLLSKFLFALPITYR